MTIGFLKPTWPVKFNYHTLMLTPASFLVVRSVSQFQPDAQEYRAHPIKLSLIAPTN